MKKTHLVMAICLLFFITGTVDAAVPLINTETQQVQINEALQELKQASRAEQKHRLKEVKKQVKEFKANKKKGMREDEQKILLVILAILLPPLAVYLHQNAVNTKFLISLLLTILFWLPGVIYSLLVVLDVI